MLRKKKNPRRAEDGDSLNSSVSQVLGPNGTYREGKLLKFTNVVSGYQPRWFVLDGDLKILSYCLTQNDIHLPPRGILYLTDADISVCDKDHLSFGITAKCGETLRLRALSPKERNDWVDHLRKAAGAEDVGDMASNASSSGFVSEIQNTISNAKASLERLIVNKTNLVNEIDAAPIAGALHLDPQLLLMKSVANELTETLKNCYALLSNSSKTPHNSKSQINMI